MQTNVNIRDLGLPVREKYRPTQGPATHWRDSGACVHYIR